MPFQAVPNTVAVHLRAQLFGQLIENILYFDKGSSLAPGDVANITDIVDVWWNTSVMPLLSNAYTYRETFGEDLTVAGGEVYTALTNSGEVGGDSTGEPLPGNVALAVSLRSGLAGRSFRGRNYISGLNVNNTDGNQFETGFLTDMQDAYNELLVQVASSDFTWVIVSRITAGVLRATGLTTPVLVAVITDIFVDSMRKRLTGRGQ